MSASDANPPIAELVRSFTGASPDGMAAAYQNLVAALWSEGKLTDLALDAVPEVIAALDAAGPDRKGHVAILLGLLAEAEYPRLDGPVATAVRAGLDSYLALVRGGSSGQPLTLALLYLLAHFPADRAAILAVTDELDLDPEERTRLARGLAELDPADPDLGQVWPAPSAWKMDEENAAHAKAAVAGLTPEQVRTNWENDTRTVWAFAGHIAYWAVNNGTPAELPAVVVPEWTFEPAQTQPTDEQFGDRAQLLRCPTCHGPIQLQGSGARCEACAATYLSANGILDLSAGVRDGVENDAATADLLQKLSEMPKMGLYYEAFLRPNYLRLAGTNIGYQVSPEFEDAYIIEHLSGTTGPVVDLAAGAGRWTEVVANAVGAERLTAVDMLLPMLNVLRNRLPEVPAVMGTALNLPFADASLGAINLWNALQAFPDDAEQAIAEIGRCLRPGGVLTMMTFRWSDDPIARHFQASHFFPSRPAGHLLFELEQLHQWLAAAGLAVRHEIVDKGTFVFITAERTA
ncbi:methyltransferase domain-containing protein [Actinokineospora sp. NPDC004072]